MGRRRNETSLLSACWLLLSDRHLETLTASLLALCGLPLTGVLECRFCECGSHKLLRPGHKLLTEVGTDAIHSPDRAAYHASRLSVDHTQDTSTDIFSTP